MAPTPPFDPDPYDNNPPILGLDGEYITRRSVYKRLRPLPRDPIPWKTSAPCSHDQLQLGTTRYMMLRDDQIRPENVQTDYEIQYLGDLGRLGHERWAPETLKNLDTQHDVPEQNLKWKTDEYHKAELEDYILDESKPQIHRIRALRDRIAVSPFHYARHDLVEKGLALLHELKFWIQGYRDWGMILFYTRQLKKQLQEGQENKDNHDPRDGQYWCYKITAPFIVEGLVQSMHHRTFDLDREFSRIFGLESSPRVKRGEPPIVWEGYDNAGPVDWGYYRVQRPMTNGNTNGHVSHSEADSEGEGQPEEGKEEDEEDEEDYSDEEGEESWSEESGGLEIRTQTLNGTDGPGQEAEEEDDESELEEISGEAFREASLARETSVARESPAGREPSSDIEITGSQVVRNFIADEAEEGYSEDDDGSQISALEGYSQEDDEMLYDEEVGNSEEGYSEEDDGETDDDGEDTARQPHPELASRIRAEVDDYSNDEMAPKRDVNLFAQEPEDNVSIADSDDLQILEEHHHDVPALGDEEFQDTTVYAMRAAEATGVDPEQADEVFDELGRPYDHDLAEMEHGDKSLFEDEPQAFVPDSLDQVYQGHDNLEDNEEASTIYQSFPVENGMLSQDLPQTGNEMVEIDPDLMANGGFAKVARKTMQHVGTGHHQSTAEPSGLSSPPPSHRAEDEAGEGEDERHASSPQVIIGETPDNEFSMTVQGDESQLRPSTADSSSRRRSSAESSQRQPRTPTAQRAVTGSFSTPGRSQEITPFRIQHPRTATGVVFVPDAAESLEEAVEDEPEGGAE